MDHPSPSSPVALGVDFGTSHTVAVLGRGDDRIRPLLFDGSPLLPSAVCADDDGGLITGRDAVRAGVRRPELIEPNPKRRIDEATILLGEREIPIGEAFAAVLARVREEAVRVAGHLDRVTLTVPATWGGPRRRRLADAALAVGMPDLRLAVEPVAAAVYFTETLDHLVPTGSAVVIPDFGAGTFDVSVVARTAEGFQVLAVDGRDDLGGLDLDTALVDYLAEQLHTRPEWRRLTGPVTETDRRHRLALLDEVRLAKEQLSRRQRADILVPLLETSAHLTRGELEQVVTPFIARAVDITARALRASGVPAERVAGVFLVGGASRMPLVSTMLHRGLGIAPTVLEQPELVVAEGSLRLGEQTPTVPIPAATPPEPERRPAPAPAPPRPEAPAAETVPLPAPEPRRRTRRAVTGAAIALAAVVAAGLIYWLYPDDEVGGGATPGGGQDPNEVEPAALYETTFYSAGNDGVPRARDIEDGEPTGTDFPGHDGIVFAADFIELDGVPALVSSGRDGHVRVWNAETGDELAAYKTHDESIGAVVATELDGVPVAISAANDDRAVVRDLESGAVIAEFEEHTDDVRAVEVHHTEDSTVVLTASNDGTVRVWDPLSGQEVGEPFEGHGDASLRALEVYNVDGRAVVASGGTDRRLITWYLDTREPIVGFDGHGGTVRVAEMIETEYGTVLVSAGDDATVYLTDPRTGEELGRFDEHDAAVYALALDARGETETKVLTGDSAGTVHVWDLDTQEGRYELTTDHEWIQSIVVP